MRSIFSFAFMYLLTLQFVYADGPADNILQNVRRIPKLGIEVPAEVREELKTKLETLFNTLLGLRESEFAQPHWPDVLIYYKAVKDSLEFNEFFDPKEIKIAHDLLEEGYSRARSLAKEETPWLTKPGPTVRGYISEIDGSVQPYGLVIPAGYDQKSDKKHRLDFWFHGRGENLSELNFLNERRKNPGQFTPAETFVLHPYGRYCNANKFAGEIDALEALTHVQEMFLIDENRINVRGFSMGGAACWQFATHYSDRWCAAAPGAGFSETPDFLKVFQKETLQPTWWEKKLWHWYDCTDWAENLTYLPTIAYSGEKDIQKQAADIMSVAMEKAGLKLNHVIGPNTGHSYEAKAKDVINQFVDQANVEGRNSILPSKIKFTTYTLRYNSMYWLKVLALQQHWEKALAEGALFHEKQAITLKTQNITRLALDFGEHFATPEGLFERETPIQLTIDGQTLTLPGIEISKPWKAVLEKANNAWKIGNNEVASLQKQPGLQGPIDDAFLSPFMFVLPTGKSQHAAVEKWVESESTRAIEHWRRHFRGEPRVMKDTEVTEEEKQKYNLVLWGDASSNKILAEIAGKLPITWNAEKIQLPDATYPADKHVLLGIYPNPLNSQRYVVLNSSFTYRDYAYLNNARQVPMLPDWAVVDITTPPNSVWPGKVVDADFFDEQWQFQRTQTK
jgi:Prolyl oligopeptidase family